MVIEQDQINAQMMKSLNRLHRKIKNGLESSQHKEERNHGRIYKYRRDEEE
jgi:hypothetical protein